MRLRLCPGYPKINPPKYLKGKIRSYKLSSNCGSLASCDYFCVCIGVLSFMNRNIVFILLQKPHKPLLRILQFRILKLTWNQDSIKYKSRQGLGNRTVHQNVCHHIAGEEVGATSKPAAGFIHSLLTVPDELRNLTEGDSSVRCNMYPCFLRRRCIRTPAVTVSGLRPSEEPSQNVPYRERPEAALPAQELGSAPWGPPGNKSRPDLLDICDRGLSTGFALSCTPNFSFALQKNVEKRERRNIF